ncbi:hypothetical protein F5B18DRAFT_655070 [Nemania serpens]|nr:hypothetical protein F5B18DRAFT_655070 [Nemania serpens]
MAPSLPPLSGLKPTRTLPQSLTRILAGRQQATTTVIADDSGTPGSVLSGGAIAGIVIGSIAGVLLLLWILRSCTNMGRPETWGNTYEPEREKRRGSGTYHVETTPYQHRDRHRSHSRHSHARSHHHHSRSPRRVEVVALEPRGGGGPRAPPSAYYGGRSSFDGRRRSADSRGYRY